jgi:hypothetical protein
MDVSRLKGSIPPLITPFRNGEVDYDAYAAMVEFQIREGSHGILVNGTTSEPASLTVEERNRIVEVAVDAAGGRVPIVAATGSQSLAETEALTDHAVRAGADVLRRLASRASIPEQQPAGRPLADLSRGQPLVLAVIPLGQIGVDHGGSAKVGQLAGLPRPLSGTDEHERECLLCERRGEPLAQPTPVVGQRDVRRAGVLPTEAPGGLPVPDRIDVHLALLPARTWGGRRSCR